MCALSSVPFCGLMPLLCSDDWICKQELLGKRLRNAQEGDVCQPSAAITGKRERVAGKKAVNKSWQAAGWGGPWEAREQGRAAAPASPMLPGGCGKEQWEGIKGTLQGLLGTALRDGVGGGGRRAGKGYRIVVELMWVLLWIGSVWAGDRASPDSVDHVSTARCGPSITRCCITGCRRLQAAVQFSGSGS